ncbi:uncharacterized protein LOC125670360 isoform X3 [Ostrea edulis]|uniref:uncharacterized protein LOC125670360 isoform X3 n=1 Tax=Ostrea edulis TaxID=37623 RepID=UPI00209587D6|nr:uncharacterized protein LOC125670360 isoform X3 [Ostrea edulis]
MYFLNLGFNLEPTTMSSLESLSADTTSGEVTAAQYVSLPYSSSEHHNNKPSVIQPSFTQSFIGERNNKSTLNRNVYPSQTLNTAQDSYKNIGKDYDWFQHLESSRTVHQKTPPVEIISSSSLSLTSQPQVSASQPQFSSEPSAQVTQPLLSAWSLYDTMLKTQDSAGIQSSVVMAITSSDVNSISSVVYKVNTKKRFISCRPGSCPAVTDICTPLVGGKFHCSCRQDWLCVYENRSYESVNLFSH